MRVTIIAAPSLGKTTIMQSSTRFVDTDELYEEATGCKINECKHVYYAHDEELFHYASRIAEKKNAHLLTNQHRVAFNTRGFVVTMDPEDYADRVMNSDREDLKNGFDRSVFVSWMRGYIDLVQTSNGFIREIKMEKDQHLEDVINAIIPSS